MRKVGLLLLAVACSRAPEPPGIAIEQSYVIRGGGGQLVVGALLPRATPVRLVSLLTRKQLEDYKNGARADEMAPSPEMPTVDWTQEGPTNARNPRYGDLEAELSKQLGVRVLIREITASERRNVPVLLEPRATLVVRCRAVLQRVRRLDDDPFRVKRTRRENSRGYIEFAHRPDRVSLVDLKGNVCWTGDPALGFDLVGITPYEHRVVAEAEGLRRAWTVGELVGTVERDLLARSEAVAGGTYAVRLIYRDTETEAPVPGEREHVRLATPDGKTITEATVVSNEEGTADVRLAIPEDTAEQTAHLHVGAARFGVSIRQAKRVSIATDRTIYRPDDRVFVRLLVRRTPSGRAIASERVRLRHAGGVQHLTTSEHGIASTEILLRDAKPGNYAITAQCGGDKARASYTVKFFELPRFEITFDPPLLRMRKGESAPIRLTARYSNGSPMIDTPVEIGKETYRTNQRGEIEFTARTGRLVTVRDTDGRMVRTWVPVILERERAEPQRKAMPIRFDKAEPKVGDTVQVDLPDEDGPMYLDIFRDGVLLRTLSSPESRFALRLEEDLAGALELHAYRFVKHAAAGHRRPLLVRRDRPLHVEARASQDEYRPGDTARIHVNVRDKAGRPTAAVLGYWAVDHALYITHGIGEGEETTFDLRPRPHANHDYDLRHRRTPESYRAARETAQGLLEDRLARLQARFKAIYAALPVEHMRTAASVRERLLWHVRRGELDPAALLDPWGTPLAFVRTHGTGRIRWIGEAVEDAAAGPQLHWSSAGPDLVWGTRDDLGLHETLEMPPEASEFFDYVVAECLTYREDIGFWGPRSWNSAIGLGGGAGGGRRGHSGRRNLRAGGGSGLMSSPVRLRRESSPTLCFVPEAIVGPDGSAQLHVPLADALTTWRMRLVASRNDGATGIGLTSIRVRQPLSVDPWIAPHLTVGDELELPVAARNETTSLLRVRLRLHASDELKVIGTREGVVEIGPGRTAAHTFRIRALTPGRARVRIDAAGGHVADAVERFISVRPDGREVVATVAGETGAWVSFAARRTGRVRLDVYPDSVAEALAGLEGMIREPHGCFEQTSSTLYPMVLVLDYLRRTQQSRPALEARARKFIASGYRRLLTYEVRSEPGGFSLYGRAPARPTLTAYGLMEFADMARVHAVDPGLIKRVVEYLHSKQQPDGSWRGGFRRTAYIAWALKNAGHPNKRAHEWLTAHVEEVEDPYALALAALAGAAELKAQSWVPAGETVFWSRGRSGEIEATALAAQALLSQGDIASARAAVKRLLGWRGRDGRFGTTQSTVQALRALLATTTDGPPRPAEIRVVSGRGNVIGKLHVEGETKSLDLGTTSRLQVRCDRELRYTVSHTSFEPWTPREPTGRVGLEVRYPTGPLGVRRTGRIHATVFQRGKGIARQAIAEIGVPPGCDIEYERVKGAKCVERGPTAVVLYLGDLKPGERRTFEIPFEPRYRLNVKTAPSKAYEYYTPERAALVPPAPIRTK
ncbi:MAG: alpha-2-macroglobulin family protein [Planctomycetota bacterium]|jgi:hypothetical protein